MAYITGLTGGAHGYFVDQNGHPRLYFADENWGLPANAGRWTSGNYQGDYDGFHSGRSGQGYIANHCHPWGHSHTGCNNDVGHTWDGLHPFAVAGSDADLTGQAGAVTLSTSGFWTRIDYMFSSAAANNMTVFFNLSMTCDMPCGANHGFTNGVFQNATTAQIQTAAGLVAARYASTPNLVWMFGDDYFNDDNTNFSAMLTGIASQDTRVDSAVAVEYFPSGCTSREDLSGSPTATPFPFGGSNATFNWVYYYWMTGWGVEQAYKENNQIPVVWGDGFFYGDAAGEPSDSHIMRNQVWWALSSGARGCTTGSDVVFLWGNTSLSAVTTETWFVSQAPVVRPLIESLPEWYNLLPDLTNSFVTAGRGTRPSYNSNEFLGGNIGSINYVTASITPDGTLALIYCAVAMSITINQSMMKQGYTATWVDPANGTTQTATPGATFSSSGLGNNSAGAPDWILVLQGPATPSSGAPPILYSMRAS